MTVLKEPYLSRRAEFTRRRILNLLFLSGLTFLSPRPVVAGFKAFTTAKRTLSLYNPNTKESFDGIYRCNGAYVSPALKKINHLMRDTRTGEVKAIDIKLLDLMFDLANRLKADVPIQVISGYRNAKSNSRLVRQGWKAAKNSYHLKGQAADIRLPGYRTSVLRRAAFQIKKGGVGYYPHLHFVHIDVGPVRYWNGNT